MTNKMRAAALSLIALSAFGVAGVAATQTASAHTSFSERDWCGHTDHDSWAHQYLDFRKHYPYNGGHRHEYASYTNSNKTSMTGYYYKMCAS